MGKHTRTPQSPKTRDRQRQRAKPKHTDAQPRGLPKPHKLKHKHAWHKQLQDDEQL